MKDQRHVRLSQDGTFASALVLGEKNDRIALTVSTPAASFLLCVTCDEARALAALITATVGEVRIQQEHDK